MGHVPYVGWATCSSATVKIRLYVLKKKNGSSHMVNGFSMSFSSWAIQELNENLELENVMW
jgi:hypothetical protein